MSEIYNMFIYKVKYIFNININNIIEGCLLNPKIFEEILREILNNKLNKKNITFLEHYNLTKHELTKRELNIICTDLYSGTEKLFNINNTPDIDVIDTIMASSSVPFFTKSVKIDDNYYIDGSFKNLFPINIFENELDKTIGICFYPIKSKNKDTFSIITNILRECIKHDIKDKIKNKLIYFIKLPSLLNTFSIHTPIKQKKEAYNLYYKLIENEINK